MSSSFPLLAAFDDERKKYYARLQSQVPAFAIAAGPVRSFLNRIISIGSFYIRVPADHLPAIVASGSVKSSMEIGTGTTVGGNPVRMKACKLLFGRDTAALKPEDFPKYGYLSCENPFKNLLVSDEMSFQYGGAAIKLRKEKLFHRTTITVGDSVNIFRCTGLMADRVDNILPVSVYGLPHGDDKPLLKLPDPGFCWRYLAAKIKDGTLTKDNFFQLDELLGDLIPVFEFFELQFHGPVTLAEDVERIDVFDFPEKVQAPEMKETAAKLEDMGIPCTASGDFDTVYHLWQDYEKNTGAAEEGGK